jgi:ABC-2 type transport system ATP-binding protein
MDHALKVEGLCKRYPGFTLSDVSFSLERGTVMGFIGRNGAGKTTTIKLIMGAALVIWGVSMQVAVLLYSKRDL